MLATNIEQEVEAIIQKNGKSGWLRVGECAKRYAMNNKSRETKFYRWRKKVGKGKVLGFQVLEFPGNISFIGLKTANPKALEVLISEDKKLRERVEISAEAANTLVYYRILEKEYGSKTAGTVANILEDLIAKYGKRQTD